MTVPNQIALFLHCTECVNEKPVGQSAASYARLEIGLTAEPDNWLQVWCQRHNRNVGLFKIDMSEVEVDLT